MKRNALRGNPFLRMEESVNKRGKPKKIKKSERKSKKKKNCS